MKNKISRDEFFKLFGQLFAGLEDQYTTTMKSRAGLPWIELRRGMRLAHFATAAEAETAAREIFETTEKINGNLLETCRIARDVWDSNSASLDPDEVKAMLDDAIAQAEKSPAQISEETADYYQTILLALTYLEDGAPKSAANVLRRSINQHEAPKDATKLSVEEIPQRWRDLLKAAEAALLYFEQCVMDCNDEDGEPVPEAEALMTAINTAKEKTPNVK